MRASPLCARARAASAEKLDVMSTAVLVTDVWEFDLVLGAYGVEEARRVIGDFSATTDEVVDRLGGTLIHIWGDKAIASFRTPAQAVRAAIEAHKRYDEVELPGGGSLTSGIGIAA